MVVFGSSYEVTVVRARGASDETRRTVLMGGDLTTKALFHLEDRVSTGDEIEFEGFDEPRVIASVSPVQTMSGISHWQAVMVPRSEWQYRHRPHVANISAVGLGARVNFQSMDQSVQNISVALKDAELARALSEIAAAVEHLTDTDERQDAALTVDQLNRELQRSSPDKSMVWTLVERFNGVGDLVGKAAQLAVVLKAFGF